jgi:hypothetical protein
VRSRFDLLVARWLAWPTSAAHRRKPRAAATTGRLGTEACRLARLVRKAERAGELRYIYGARAESDEHEANAVATVIRTLDGVDSAVIQLSSVIIVKFQGSLICRVLTDREIRIMHDHPELLRLPGELFQILSRMIGPDSGARDGYLAPLPDEGELFGTDEMSAPPVIGI